ncbi:RNA-directed DNA polymerase, eukaryota, reverse transcriptase zinc-binding domain protein [Tanacetum coccineum]
MVRQISDFEIKNAMFEIEDSKAPGPDNYTSRFYKSAWSIVGKEVSQSVREFFVTGKLLGECISKIMTNRLKGVLGTLVNENQSAFISGMQITYNILLAQELFRGYNRKQNVKKVSFKIDLQKAYDTISWEFLKDVLVMFGFHEKMVQKIEITHLCFADDLLVFCHEDCESVRIIKKSLDEFSGFSGLLPNMQKSTLLFGGLSSAEQQNILNIISFSVGKLPVRYLGVPLITKQISINDFNPLVNKVKAKINDWKNKSLSYDGRVQLIASVLSDLTKGKAKVSWDAVCKPKDHGGLGLKNLGVWNEVTDIHKKDKNKAKKGQNRARDWKRATLAILSNTIGGKDVEEI